MSKKTPTPKSPKPASKVRPPAFARKPASENPLDNATADPVESETDQPPAPAPAQTPARPAGSTKHMELTLKQKPGARKSDRLVIFDYTDRKGSVQFLRTLFGEAVPETITISGEFASPKEKMTAEQRKEARKNMTPAQQLEAAEKRLEVLRKKVAAASAQPPAGDAATA